MTLALPHHDGSPRYVDHSDPQLGDTVRVRVHVPHESGGAPAADTVAVRSVQDGEPVFAVATQDSADEFGSWWSAEVRVRNPVASYRFLLDGGAGGYRWLNAAGVHGHDVTDVQDFRLLADQHLPAWVPDAVGYQIFPDRFARTETGAPLPEWAMPAQWDDAVIHSGPATPRQLFGGTLDGIVEHLDHVRSLGINTLYLTPFFPSRSNHRYDASSFDVVDPILGGDAAFERLVAAAHGAGLRLVGDLTTNHTGAAHEWFVKAQDPSTEERGYYHFDDSPLGYEAWFGVPSLPKLNHASEALARRFQRGRESVVGHWLAQGLDAWRIDVANMTGRLGRDDRAHQVASDIRATMREVRPDSWLLAEHCHDATHDLNGSGWHGTMNYLGFTKPAWTWLNAGFPGGPGVEHGLRYLGQPAHIPSLDGVAAATTMREVHAEMAWSARLASTNHLDTHDTPRFRTICGGGVDGIDHDGRGRDRHLVGIALQFTVPGVPMMFMGDEVGLTGVDGEHSRTPMPWARPADWDAQTLAAYRTWIALRNGHVALRQGSFRWVAVGPDSLTFLREHPDETLLVHLARADHEPLQLSAAALGGARALDVLVGEAASGFDLPRHGPAAHVYAVTRS